eukprot:GHVS01083996.1.p1 GENE.GHVS01083996.1~~GHVS01083996.1.p1  ORF type:complete len:285 (-),score=38.97 GHVS01083996.1:328-1182(-)
MVRLDMSEYMERHSTSRLVGAPPGYVGYKQGGQLTEAVRRRPYSVVLLDEMEKAHPEVFNVFLQIMEDGRVTDGKGTVVNFKNCILIFTSNLGSQQLLEANAESKQEIRELVLDEVRRHFRLEFVNRVDEFVVLNPLGRRDLHQIVELEVAKIQSRLEDKQIRLTVAGPAVDWIVHESYLPQYGARPLRRAVQKELETPLSRAILADEVVAGDRVEATADEVPSHISGEVLALIRGSSVSEDAKCEMTPDNFEIVNKISTVGRKIYFNVRRLRQDQINENDASQ